jgi:phosphonopyruvate decarboxylase
MQDSQTPVCVLKIRERFNKPPQIVRQAESEKKPGKLLREDKNGLSISREEAIAALLPRIEQNIAVISSTGLISRSIYQSYDAPNQFYNAGAFGLTSSIGLGLARARPNLKVIIIEGDGSVLADIGNLNLIGGQRPKNLIHVVLNNKAYVSCSGEPTCQPELIPELACQFGYDKVYNVNSQEGARRILDEIIETEGLQMLHIDINTEGGRSFDRPTAMANIARRFRAHFTYD